MDREKVVKAVDICLGHGKCNDCPYCLSGKGYTTMNCRDYMLRDVIALLKEQEKTPVVFSQDDGSVTTACGNCGWDLDKAYSRCPKCQKELDWNALQE